MKQLYQTPRSTVNHVLWAITLASFGLVASVCSQTADAFNPGASRYIYALAVQMDGRILVGGDFYMLGGQVRNRLGRLNPDGSLDPDFNPGAIGRVSCLAVQADGKIVVGGAFTKLCGQARNCLGRLNADGSLDISFNPNANGEVCALAVQTDGKIIVGGGFYMLGGEIHDYIGRLNADGSVDPSFNSGTGASYPSYPYVYSLAVQPDGQILVGGVFTKLDGETRNRIGRLYPDGTLDTSFNPGAWAADPNAAVSSLAVQADGKILVGGGFTNLCSQRRNYIGRLNPNGSLDTGFNPGANGYLHSLALQADGKILVGGQFTTLGGQPRNYLGRLNVNGSLDTGFNPGANGLVYGLALQADGRILVGGCFTALGGQPRFYIGRLYNTAPATQSLTYDGSTLTWLRGDTSPEVSRTTFEGSTDGLDWLSLGAGERISGGWQLTGLSWPTNATVRACGSAVGGYRNASEWVVHTGLGPPGGVTQPISRTNDAATVVCFSALAVGTEPLSYQWRKGETNLSDGGNVFGTATPILMLTNVLGGDAGAYSVVVTNSCGGLTSSVATLTVVDPLITNQPGSQSTTPGQFIGLSVAVVGTPPLAYQWRKDGASLTGATTSSLSWTNVQGSDAGSYDVVVTNLYGSVTSAVAVLTVNLATWDASFSASSGGSSPYVQTLVLQADGKILVGGSFTLLGGQPRDHLGRLNANGSLDLSFNPGAGSWVNCVAVQADGKIVVGGGFTTLGGQPRSYLGRLNADGSLDTTFNPGAGYNVNCLAVQADGKILVGGGFTTLGGQPRNRLGRLNTDGSLDLSFNPGAGSWVNCLAVQPDGKILVGGEFTTLGGQARNYIGRLDASGNLDPSFDPGAGGNSNPYVGVVAVQADGKILVGGGFTTLGGQPRNRLGRLNADGSLDLSFNPDAGSWVNCLARAGRRQDSGRGRLRHASGPGAQQSRTVEWGWQPRHQLRSDRLRRCGLRHAANGREDFGGRRPLATGRPTVLQPRAPQQRHPGDSEPDL